MPAAQLSIKVAIAADFPVYRMGLRKLFESQSDIIIVGEAGNGMETLLLLERFEPDVLLLDLKMPVMDGLDVLSEINKRKLRTRTVLMMSDTEREKAVRAVRLGARGIVFKEADPTLLVKSIRKVHQGEVWIDNPILSQALESIVSKPGQPALPGERRDKLSNREMEVVRCVALGLRNKEVADKLGVSEATVKNHLTSVYAKLGVSDRLELILYVIHHRLIRL
ncbi:MAG: response regulator [Terriglobia bacterium]